MGMGHKPGALAGLDSRLAFLESQRGTLPDGFACVFPDPVQALEFGFTVRAWPLHHWNVFQIIEQGGYHSDMTKLDERVESASSQIEKSKNEAAEYKTIVCDLEFNCDPAVFSPKYFKSTEIHARGFPYRRGEKLLEIGPGVGVTAVIAALRHSNEVVAIDINERAVQVTRSNALLHGVQDRVDVRHGDLFSPLKSTETFNTLYWDFPFVLPPEGFQFESDLMRSFYDPGYLQIEKFLSQASRWLEPQGRIIVGFGSNGDFDRFDELARRLGYHFKEISRASIEERGGISYFLLECLLPGCP